MGILNNGQSVSVWMVIVVSNGWTNINSRVLIPLWWKCSKVCLPIENCSGGGFPRPPLLSPQFAQRLSLLLGFCLTFESIGQYYLLSITLWVLCLLPSPLSPFLSREHMRRQIGPISCELWLILTNQQLVLRRLWAPLILAAIFWCMREGFYHLPVRDERNAVECKKIE